MGVLRDEAIPTTLEATTALLTGLFTFFVFAFEPIATAMASFHWLLQWAGLTVALLLISGGIYWLKHKELSTVIGQITERQMVAALFILSIGFFFSLQSGGLVAPESATYAYQAMSATSPIAVDLPLVSLLIPAFIWVAAQLFGDAAGDVMDVVLWKKKSIIGQK